MADANITDTVTPEARRQVARELLTRVKQIEEGDGSWNGGDVVELLSEWFTGLGLDIEGPGPRSCESCEYMEDPAQWHDDDGHAAWAAEHETYHEEDTRHA
jgi:hypothetical protein